jgi:hypothetical protein
MGGHVLSNKQKMEADFYVPNILHLRVVGHKLLRQLQKLYGSVTTSQNLLNHIRTFSAPHQISHTYRYFIKSITNYLTRHITMNSNLETLLSMGFPSEQCNQALVVANGDLDMAINLILSGSLTQSAAEQGTMSSSQSPIMVQIDLNQYSFPEGTSACTCIAMKSASAFLTAMNDSVSATNIITPEFLQKSLIHGIETYKKFPKGLSEHKSPEEVLVNTPESFHMRLHPSGVRQGLLSDNENNQLGLKQTLTNCMDVDGSGWMAVILTKTPETICVCLPTKNNTSPIGNNFILIDSHPRPYLGYSGSYALLHSSLDDLVHSLKLIFPVSSIGTGLLAEMYNTFDAYVMLKTF